MNPQTAVGYLNRLEERLRYGADVLPAGLLRRQAAYLRASQHESGGFVGPGGVPDFYYTHFALEAINLLESTGLEVDGGGLWQRVEGFVLSGFFSVDTVVDCYCGLRSVRLLDGRGCCVERPEVVATASEVLSDCRHAAGGFGGGKGKVAQVYTTFLAGLCYGLLGKRPPDVDRDVDFILARRASDGGFADREAGADGRTGGASPTAAALGYLTDWSGLSDPVRRGALGFLANLQAPSGGFRAHRLSPVADLLSTFTSLVALEEAKAVGRAKLATAGRFARQLSDSAGGFRSTLAAEAPDVEFTFYGLGTLAILGGEVRRQAVERETMTATAARDQK